MKKEIQGVVIECIQGDISSQKDMTAVVNAANAQLRPGGGVAGALHRAAGLGLEEGCRPLAPIRPGEGVITGAYNLPNKYVIHCLGPVYGQDRPEDELLASCYFNALRLAEANQVDSIAFPALSTGAFGYPKDLAAEVAFKAIKRKLPELKHVKHIRFVLHGEKSLAVHQESLEKIIGSDD